MSWQERLQNMLTPLAKPLVLATWGVYGMYAIEKWHETTRRAELAKQQLDIVAKTEANLIGDMSDIRATAIASLVKKGLLISNGMMNFSTVHLWDFSWISKKNNKTTDIN